jgi:hypothetical protein
MNRSAPLLLSLALVLAAACEARAEAPSNPPQRSTAYSLAVTGSLATVAAGAFTAAAGSHRTGFGIAAAGLVLAPSLGQVYAGSLWQGAAGAAVRGIGVTLFAIGFAQGDLLCGMGDCSGTDQGDGLEITGLTLVGLGLVHGFLDTHYAVSRAEARHRRPLTRRWEIQPTLAFASDGESLVGGLATVRF